MTLSRLPRKSTYVSNSFINTRLQLYLIIRPLNNTVKKSKGDKIGSGKQDKLFLLLINNDSACNLDYNLNKSCKHI